MFAAIVLATFHFQNADPVLPPSCSTTFQAAVLSVEEALQRQDFESAKARFQLLPSTSVTYVWDESKVPQIYRGEFGKARDAAFAMWKAKVPNLQLNPSPSGTIRFSFEQVLANRPNSNLPAGHIGFFSDDPSKNRLDFVMGLKRGKPLQKTEVTDVFDDVSYAVGLYFGVSDGIDISHTMGQSDLPRMSMVSISGTELTAVKTNQRAMLALKYAIDKRFQLAPTKSELLLDQMVIQAPSSLQGDRVDLDIKATNNGDGPLSFSLQPDCGCTAVTGPGTIPPHSTELLKIAIDTRLFSRDMVKRVMIYSNDPTDPMKIVTIKVPIRERYRFIAPDGDTIVVPAGGRKYVVYLIRAYGADLDPVSYKFDGMHASVAMQPFHGVITDPEDNEGPKLQSGFKFVVNIKDDLPPGRVSGVLQVFTSSSDFPNISHAMYAQRGIISLPEEVPMGTIGRAPRSAYFLVSGPGTGMKVLSVETNCPNLTATFDQVPGPLGYTVHVEYDGKAKKGELIAEVNVRTSDPKQPIIHVPIHAMIQ